MLCWDYLHPIKGERGRGEGDLSPLGKEGSGTPQMQKPFIGFHRNGHHEIEQWEFISYKLSHIKGCLTR